MTNSNWEKQLEEIRQRVNERQFWQNVGATQVATDELVKNAGGSRDSVCRGFANSRPDNNMRTRAACASNAIQRNALLANDLAAGEEREGATESSAKRERLIAPSKLVRWSKFNLVGGIGIAVQFVALFLLKTVLHLDYLVATALAVEAAVLHNFVWHERFTWVDRARPDRTSGRMKPDGMASPFFWLSLVRLVRFHLGNGAVSILGNMALMKLLVGQGHMNYLVANAIAIALCSVANFLVSDEWVFGN